MMGYFIICIGCIGAPIVWHSAACHCDSPSLHSLQADTASWLKWIAHHNGHHSSWCHIMMASLQADRLSASTTYGFILNYLDDVNYTMNYIFLFILSASVYKFYHDLKSLFKRGHQHLCWLLIADSGPLQGGKFTRQIGAWEAPDSKCLRWHHSIFNDLISATVFNNPYPVDTYLYDISRSKQRSDN